MPTRRPQNWLSLATVAVMLATACTPAATPAPAATEAPPEPGSITIWTRYDLASTEDANAVTLKARIDAFQAETGITVVHETIAWDQLAPKLALAVQSGGEVPDIVEAGSQHIPSLLDAGALEPLDTPLAGEAWVAELTDGDKKACVIDGVRYCVAHNVRGGAMYYRTADFPNGFPTSAEAWLTEGARLQGEGKQLTTFFAGRNYGAIETAWWPYIKSNGGSLFDAEGKPAWDTPEVAEVVEFGRQLFGGGYAPEVDVTGDWSDSETPWIDGQTASFRGGSWSAIFVSGLQDQVDAGDVAMTGGVAFGDGAPYVFMVSEGWVIPKGAQNPAGAVAWLRGFMEPKFLSAWAEAQFGIPTTEAAYAAGQFQGSPFYQQVDEILSTQGAYMEPSPYYVESLDILATTWQELLLNPDLDVAAKLAEAKQEVLNRYWK